MSNQDRQQEVAQLERVNEELTRSLERCRELLSECRSKLAANSNGAPEEDQSSQTG